MPEILDVALQELLEGNEEIFVGNIPRAKRVLMNAPILKVVAYLDKSALSFQKSNLLVAQLDSFNLL